MIFGRVCIRLVSSDVPARLHYISSQGIILRNIHQTDLLTATFTVSRKEYSKIALYLDSKGDKHTLLANIGAWQSVVKAVKRPILSSAVLLLLFLTLWVPTKVFFIRVEGNETVPTKRIHQCAENAGIAFASDVRSLRSERIKNSLLQQIPELSWVGVNTKGCVATISVVERQSQAEKEGNEYTISNVVASHDAQVLEITAIAGNPICKPGDIVSKGQVLISGYTDCGIKIQATQARGEVFGKTAYKTTAVFPSVYGAKTKLITKNRNIFLQIGKKEIKLWKGSGISGSICDKMYSQKYLTLPGGFALPLGIRIETCVYYRPAQIALSFAEAQPILEHQARQWLIGSMVSGQILSQTLDFSQDEGAYCLTGRYVCREMVGRVQYEKIGAYHEQIIGKNRQRR